jgi:hypothetical protein
LTINVISLRVLTVVEVFAPTPAELVRRYGAKKLQDEKYEVSPLNLPWVFKQEVDMVLKPGGRYVIEGVQVEGLTPPWEAYVALVDQNGDFGVGYVAAKRRRMFSCIYKTYSKPLGLQLAPYIEVKPVQLLLTDKEGVVGCVDRALHARYIAVFINAPANLLQSLKIVVTPKIKENV